MSTYAPSLSNISSEMRGLDKELDSTFYCPKIVFENYAIHRSRSVLPDKVELLQLI